MNQEAADELYKQLSKTACQHGMGTVLKALQRFLRETTRAGIQRVQFTVDNALAEAQE